MKYEVSISSYLAQLCIKTGDWNSVHLALSKSTKFTKYVAAGSDCISEVLTCEWYGSSHVTLSKKASKFTSQNYPLNWFNCWKKKN